MLRERDILNKNVVKADERTKKQIDLVKRQAGSGTDFRMRLKNPKQLRQAEADEHVFETRRRVCFFCAHASSGYIDMRLWWQGWVLAFSHVSHFRKLQIAYPFLFATLRHGSHGISSGFQSISCYGFEDFSQLNYILYYNNGDIVQDFVTLSKDLWGFRDNIGVYGQSFHGLHMPTWYCFCLNPHAVLLPTILMSFAAVSSLP